MVAISFIVIAHTETQKENDFSENVNLVFPSK